MFLRKITRKELFNMVSNLDIYKGKFNIGDKGDKRECV